MSLIDYTYFTGEINIPQAATNDRLTQAINQYEKEFLILLLGYELYKALIADLDGGVPQTDRFKDLIQGAEFTHSYNGEDRLLKWEGLTNDTLLSPIAFYVYYKFVERDISEWKTSGVGVVPGGKDWDRRNPTYKLAEVWDRLRDMYGRIPVRYKDTVTYPVLGSNISGPYDFNPSAFNFLYTNKDDYAEWVFTPLWNINVFGI